MKQKLLFKLKPTDPSINMLKKALANFKKNDYQIDSLKTKSFFYIDYFYKNIKVRLKFIAVSPTTIRVYQFLEPVYFEKSFPFLKEEFSEKVEFLVAVERLGNSKKCGILELIKYHEQDDLLSFVLQNMEQF